MKNKKHIFCAAVLMGSLQLTATAQTLADSLAVGQQVVDFGRTIQQDERYVTGAVSTVHSDKLSHKNSVRPATQLYGMLPGLTALQNSGAVWEENASFFVRGMGTTSSKNPLVLVDGFERSMNELSSLEIESVSVLKDAAATAIYGIRGANGVILVTTKRGTVAKPEINFSYEFNFATPNRLPDFVDGYTYAQALNEALVNDGSPARYNQAELDAFRDQTYPNFYPNVDWMDEALRGAAYGDNVSFSARGGGNFVRYYTMLNFLDNRGILKPTEENDGYSTQLKYSKLNIRTNLDISVSPTTTVQLNLLGNFTEHNRPGTTVTDLFNLLYQIPAGAFPVKTDQEAWGATTTYRNNPIAAIAAKGYARSQTRALFADMHLRQDLSSITKGLSAGFKIALDNSASYWDSNTKSYLSQQAIIDLETGEPTFNKLSNEGNLSFSKSVGSTTTHFNFQLYTDYARQWGDHRLNATLLYNMDKIKSKGRNTGRAYMDATAHANYAYKNRYLVDLTLSGSASSLLEPGHRWGLFPALGAGWILSEEEFMKNDWLNFLKLRASYGISGRADYSVDAFMQTFGGGRGYYFKDTPTSLSGMKLTQLGVQGLTYEKSHKFNVGVDMKAFNNRMSLTLDAFYDHRTDILVSANSVVSSIFGLSYPSANDGVVDSKGLEASLQWDDCIGSVSYHAGAQFSYAKNTIKEMNEEYRPYAYQNRTGKSVGQYFGYEVIGIYQSQEEIDNRPVKQYLGDVKPGDLMFKDQNNDGRIDSYDQVALGYNTSCPQLYYSLDLGAEYKGLGFYALFQGVGNYSKQLDTRSIYRPLVGNNTISTWYYENRWSPENPNGTLPRLTYAGSDNNYNNNSLWLADASYLKLRTLELYYKLPQQWLKKSKYLSDVKLFARGHDLFCLDKIDIRDPEAVGSVHPTMTQYVFGFNLTF